MKSNSEIVSERRVIVEQVSGDGGSGWVPGLDMKKPNNRARVVWSFGGGWDHVSVSWEKRCPTWEEMCRVKKLFFHPEEVCVQFHPAESEYVNYHPYCLHIWRCQAETMPTPKAWMVGLKDGQTMNELRREAERDLKEAAVRQRHETGEQTDRHL